MNRRTWEFLVFTTVICCVITSPLFSQTNATLRMHLKPYHPAPHGIAPARMSSFSGTSSDAADPAGAIRFTHWTFTVTSSRDDNTYFGLMVGNRALDGGSAPSNIPVEIVPVIVNTVALGTAIDAKTLKITVTTGSAKDDTSFNPTTADNSCLVSPNNIPTTVFRQSPLFEPALFNYGGTNVGFTQATDAFQRANFWNTIDRNSYHVLLSAKVLPPLVLNVPAPSKGVGGLALDLPGLFGLCGRIGLVDINTIDSFVTGALSHLLAQGVNPSNLPIFMFYNTAFPIGDPTNLNNCCAGGYHNVVNVGTQQDPVLQTYSPLDFDMTGFFINDTGSPVLDAEIASHEVGEWMDDPLTSNQVPAWGHTGQVGACQNNLEVGDPLTGLEAPRIFMPNGFTYHLQELAFFSWFFGSVNDGPPSIGIHDWFSDNDSFTSNAGPVCVSKM